MKIRKEIKKISDMDEEKYSQNFENVVRRERERERVRKRERVRESKRERERENGKMRKVTKKIGT